MNHARRTVPAVLLLLVGLLTGGCPRTNYLVDLTPRGTEVERRLVFYQAGEEEPLDTTNYAAPPADKLAAVARAHPAGRVATNTLPYTVQGRFGARLPADLGGGGGYTNILTDLGGAGFYLERFQGNDDVSGRIAQIQKAADEWVDLLLGWSRQELRDARGYRQWRRFLDGDFRRDFRNLCLHWWLVEADLVRRSPTPEEAGVRFLQYLTERGYANLTELPQLFALVTANDDGRTQLAWLQRQVASRMGVAANQPIPVELEFLADPVRMAASWDRYLQTTERYRALARHWEREKMAHEIDTLRHRWAVWQGRTNTPPVPAAPGRPDPGAVTEAVAKQLLTYPLFGTDDRIVVRLALPGAPIRSNGKWDAATGRLVWESARTADPDSPRWPGFGYAQWSVPDVAAQTRPFGRVVLKGDALSQYCLWRAALRPGPAREWGNFLQTLQPGTNLTAQVDKFRFQGEPATPPKQPVTTGRPPPSSEMVRQLLAEALKPEP